MFEFFFDKMEDFLCIILHFHYFCLKKQTKSESKGQKVSKNFHFLQKDSRKKYLKRLSEHRI